MIWPLASAKNIPLVGYFLMVLVKYLAGLNIPQYE